MTPAQLPARFTLDDVQNWHQKGDVIRAEAGYRAILAQKPREFEVIHMLGVLCMQNQRMAEAGRYLQQAMAGGATLVMEYHYAFWLVQEKRFTEALPYLDKVLNQEAHHIQARRQRAIAHFHLNNWDLALQDCDILLKQNPALSRMKLLRCRVLFHLKKWSLAGEAYQEVRQVLPGSEEIYQLGANIYLAQGRGGMVVRELKELIRVQPKPGFEIYLELGNAWIMRLLEPVAGDLSDEEIGADHTYALPGLGNAIACYRQGVELEPQHAQGNYNLGLCLLMTGQWREGWERYEYRWRVKNLDKTLGERSFPEAAWDGVGRLHGKRLLIHAEQGVGDILQFCRYAKLLQDLGAYVMLLVPNDLQKFLRFSLEGVNQWVDEGWMPPYDLHCPVLSLPRALSLLPQNIPPVGEYIRAKDIDIIRMQVATRAVGGAPHALRIGLAWAGSTVHYNNHNRSLPLPTLLEHFSVGEHQGFCLHHELSEEHQSLLEKTGNIHALELGRDWFATAALIMNMDLIISIDTGVAHLAAALGKPTWIMTNWFADFRWLLALTDTPWYDTVLLFRQQHHGDWVGLLKEVETALQNYGKPSSI